MFWNKKDKDENNETIESNEIDTTVEAEEKADVDYSLDSDEEEVEEKVEETTSEPVYAVEVADDSTEETKEDKKAKKAKKEKNGVVKTFNLYKFIIKIVATILLLTLGILVLVFQSNAIFAIYLITGGITVFQALIRATFLLRRDRNPKAKLASLVEILLELTLGALFLFFAYAKFHWINFNDKPDAEEYNEFLINASVWAGANYSLFAGLIFFTAVASFMFRTILFNERCGKVKFGIYFTQFVAGALLLVMYAMPTSYDESLIKNGELVIENVAVITPLAIAITIAVLSLVSAVVIGGEAAIGFWRYYTATHPEIAERKAQKKAAKEAKRKLKEEGVDYTDIDPNTIPKDNKSNNDSTYVN